VLRNVIHKVLCCEVSIGREWQPNLRHGRGDQTRDRRMWCSNKLLLWYGDIIISSRKKERWIVKLYHVIPFRCTQIHLRSYDVVMQLQCNLTS